MTESSPPDFLQGHSQTLLLHLSSPPSYSLLLSPISTPLQPQSSLTGLYFSPSSPPSSRVTSQLLSIPSQVPRVPF